MKKRLSTFRLLLVAASLAAIHADASADHDSQPVADQSTTANPFARFFGDWTLKQDLWTQQYGDQPRQTITITDHHTRCQAINTENSILCVVSSPGLDGHILWTLDRQQKSVHHLSNFTPNRNGVGNGYVDEDGNVHLRVTFEGEPEGTHRRYHYRWISDNEYRLESTQYRGDQPTKSFYGGNFIKVIHTRETKKQP